MEIWIKKTEADKIRLPVNPQSFELECKMNNTTININSVGDRTLIGKRGLDEIELQSFFPAREYDFLQYQTGLLKPYEYCEKIENWMTGSVQLIITGTNINMWATIESFKYGENDRTGDVSFSVSLKKHTQIAQKKPAAASKQGKASKKITKPASKRATKEVKSTNYTVKKGDTLMKIAKKKTGNSSNWRAIYNQNKSIIEKTAKKRGKKSSSTGHWIYPGTKLVIKT